MASRKYVSGSEAAVLLLFLVLLLEAVCTSMAIRESSPTIENFVTGVRCASNFERNTVIMPN